MGIDVRRSAGPIVLYIVNCPVSDGHNHKIRDAQIKSEIVEIDERDDECVRVCVCAMCIKKRTFGRKCRGRKLRISFAVALSQTE